MQPRGVMRRLALSLPALTALALAACSGSVVPHAGGATTGGGSTSVGSGGATVTSSVTALDVPWSKSFGANGLVD